MSNREEVTPEFQEYYDAIDKKTSELAYAILEHVKKNDVRLLKKIKNRLTQVISDINEIK